MESSPHHFTKNQKYIGFLFLATILLIVFASFIILQRIQNETALQTTSSARERSAPVSQQGESQKTKIMQTTPQGQDSQSTTSSCYKSCKLNRYCSGGLTCQDFPIGAGVVSLCVNPENPSDTTCSSSQVLGCRKSCSVDNECASGFVCKHDNSNPLSGKCVNPRNPDNELCLEPSPTQTPNCMGSAGGGPGYCGIHFDCPHGYDTNNPVFRQGGYQGIQCKLDKEDSRNGKLFISCIRINDGPGTCDNFDRNWDDWMKLISGICKC